MTLPGFIAEVVGDSDDWYTPPLIFDALGLRFDLDPCAPVGGLPWIPAARYYTEADDGLAQEWYGRVWLNPPYSKPWPWVERLAEHGNGIALIQADTSTRGWHEWVAKAHVVCFVRGRLQYVRGDLEPQSARFASALVAFGDVCAEAVRRSNLGWCVTKSKSGVARDD